MNISRYGKNMLMNTFFGNYYKQKLTF